MTTTTGELGGIGRMEDTKVYCNKKSAKVKKKNVINAIKCKKKRGKTNKKNPLDLFEFLLKYDS